ALFEPHLAVVLACDSPEAGASRHAMAEVDEVRIGRGVARRVARRTVEARRVLELALPDARLSEVHAALTREGDEWVLVDKGSRNGAYVRGRRVSRQQLMEGDIVELGRTLFLFRRDMITPPATPLDAFDDALAVPVAFRTLVPQLSASFANL